MNGRTILITGCSSGIGLASAQMLKARGWRVLATARKPEDLQRLTKEQGLEAIYLELADPAAIARPLDRVGPIREGGGPGPRVQFPVLGLDDRGEPPRQRGIPDREETRVGL